MITAILLIYIGIDLDAPWWYFGLIALHTTFQIFIECLEVVEDGNYDS